LTDSTPFSTFQHVDSTPFNGFQHPTELLALTLRELGLTRPLLANRFHSSSRKVFVMDSETINGRSRKRGGGRAYRSRLEPFVDFIRAQRQQRKTWQEIAESLNTEKGCAITFQGLHQFYRRYVKRQARPHWENGNMPEVLPPARPASRPEANRPILAEIPAARPFRQPNPEDIKLNDPTEL
jgi:hypothetical protein